MIARETLKHRPLVRAAKSEAELRSAIEQMSEAMLVGTERVKSEMLSQMRAWTIAGLEDRSDEPSVV
jgi:hypothetical protein